MGEIADAFRVAYNDGPSSDPDEPYKESLRRLGVTIENGIQGAAVGIKSAKTWAELAAVVGTTALQKGEVTNDAGTHTDPVVGGTVANKGSYSWSTSPAGWKRTGDVVDLALVEAAVDEVEAIAASIEQAAAQQYPNYEVELCGYRYAEVDGNFVLLSFVDEDGQTFGTAGYNELEAKIEASGPLVGYEVELCGWRYAEIDANDVILSGYTDVGVAYPAANDNLAAEYVETTDAQAYSVPSALTRKLYIQPVSTKLLRLVTDQDRPRNITLSPSSVIWTSDDLDARDGLWHQPIAGGSIAPVLPMASICVLGDSLTAGHGASTIPLRWRSLIAASTGLPVINGGVGGQTSREIAARFDATRALFTVTGNSIPGSGSVAVTAWSVSPITDQGPGPLFGWLAGVYGSISAGGYDGNGRPTSISFTRATVGSVTPCPAGTEWVSDVGTNLSNGDRMIATLWMGRNNNSQVSQILADYAACYARVRTLVKRVLVISNVNGAGEGTGTSTHTNMTSVNSSLASTYGDAFVDVQAALVAAYDPGQPQDVLDHANDIVPASLRADGTHHNDAGQQVVHDTILAKLNELNWLGDLAA